MAKQLTVLLGMMALLLTTALPAAFAQGAAQYGGEEVSATGVIFDGLPQDVGGFGTHSITDEATGTLYALRSAGPDLASYGSQRVTVHGALTPGEEGTGEGEFGASGTLPSIDVTRVEPAGGPVEGEEISVSFELFVEGEPPEGTRLYAAVSQGVPVYETVGLHDPDGDGLYAGAMTLSEEVFDFGAYPISVQILSHQPGAGPQTIKDFGEVEPEDGDVFSAEFSFDGTQPPPPPVNTVMAAGTIERMQPDTGYVLTDGPRGAVLYGLTSASPGMDFAAYEGRMVAVYGAVSEELSEGGPFPVLVVTRIEPVDVDPVDPAPVDPAPGGAVVSGDTNHDKGGVSADGSGSEQGIVSSARVLPATGGVLPIAAAAGALLLAGWGLIARSFTR